MSYVNKPRNNNILHQTAGKTSNFFIFYVFSVCVIIFSVFLPTLRTKLFGATTSEIVSNPYVKIDSLSVSQFNDHPSLWYWSSWSSRRDPNQISGDWNVDINVMNFNIRDGMTFCFSNVTLSILHVDKDNETTTPLWTTTLPDFELGPRNVTGHLVGDFWGSSGFVKNSTLTGIEEGILREGKARFNVELDSSLSECVKQQHKWLKAYCEDIELVFHTKHQGKMLTPPKECDVLVHNLPY